MATKAAARKQKNKNIFFNIFYFFYKNKKLKYILFNTKPFIK